MTDTRKRILKKLKKIWKLNTGMRFGQLLDIVAFREDEEIFYVEDKIVEGRLEEYLKKIIK